MALSNYSDTGNGATIVFGTSAFVARWREIGPNQQIVDTIDTSHLGITRGNAMTSIPSDLFNPGDIELEFEWPLGGLCPLRQASETITLTWPLPTGKSVASTLAGTGFISKRSYPQMKNGVLMVGKATVHFDGLTGPTYTHES